MTKVNNALDLLKRPNVSFDDISELTQSPVSAEVGEQIEIGVKYAGYIDRQQVEIGQMKKLEHTLIPDDFTYHDISGLSNEIVQKLEKVRPTTLAQASRISGVTPAAVQLLAMRITKSKKAREVLSSYNYTMLMVDKSHGIDMCHTCDFFILCRRKTTDFRRWI